MTGGGRVCPAPFGPGSKGLAEGGREAEGSAEVEEAGSPRGNVDDEFVFLKVGNVLFGIVDVAEVLDPGTGPAPVPEPDAVALPFPFPLVDELEVAFFFANCIN